MQAAGGIDNERVAAQDDRLAAGLIGQALDQRGAGGLALLVALLELGLSGLGDDLELLAGGGAVDVDRYQHGAVTTLFEPCG